MHGLAFEVAQEQAAGSETAAAEAAAMGRLIARLEERRARPPAR